MLIQFLKAGKLSNWSLVMSWVRWTGHSGVEFGRVKVDIAARSVVVEERDRVQWMVQCLLMSLSRGIICMSCDCKEYGVRARRLT